MAGGVLMAIVLLLVLPVGVMLAGAAWSLLNGLLLVDDAERRAADQPV
ncbi:MAG: hypothetical protein KJ056_01815 [Acidimicrobiia bacterium]|nr:hypothetical protein [Acidimicrobiia bacterium]